MIRGLKHTELLEKMGLSESEIRSRLITRGSRNKSYWLERGYSEEESIKYSRSRMPGTIEYYTIYKNYSQIDAENLHKKWNEEKAITLVNLIKKYGESDGTKKWESYRKRQAYTNTLEYFIEKYGEVKWTEKYKKYNFLKSHNYESYLERCNGDVELATKKLTDYHKLVSTGTLSKGYSKISQELFDSLREILIENGYKKIFYATYNQEWFVIENHKFICYLDFFVKESGKVIEFNGDFWHANPSFYKKDDIINFPVSPMSAKELWEKDSKKLELLNKVPYINSVLTIWENDYRLNKQKVLDLCKNYLLK